MPRIKQVAPSKNGKAFRHVLSDASKSALQQPQPSKDIELAIKKKRRKKPGTGALLEIRRLQKRDKNIIPKAAFCRLLKEILGDVCTDGPLRMQGKAVRVLQETASKYLHHIFVMGTALSVKDKRIKLTVRDFTMAANIVSGAYVHSLDMPDASERLISSRSPRLLALTVPKPKPQPEKKTPKPDKPKKTVKKPTSSESTLNSDNED
ncbi:histone H3 [Cymbomonas tetramitiformis]|uniref:Histone H3 n=1 Tax=Cymbomonas tetramitiformis TaxID=36881 RepID=A0AAE0C8A8_9CHLO|nr:histone H3 [Cymbomonas tetramitiformis]KAK3249548.1 histone H3 [Cymbomonas tetramitiformis]KAK3249574.1 histone H3 [Cymbomonas tetramitiformis]